MKLTIKEYIKLTCLEEDIMNPYMSKYHIRNRVYCKDDYNISMQGNEGSYSSPKMLSEVYSSMELGFPSEEDELINEYAEETGNYTETVYGYVPFDVIEKLIEKHGGIDVMKTCEKCEEPGILEFMRINSRVNKMKTII